MNWRQAVTIAVVFGVVAAGLVWWLEGFERKRLVADWQSFVEGWARAPDPG